MVCTITSEADGYANEVADAMKAAGLRVETDLRNEKIGYKVREHSLAKVPVILAVGLRDAEARNVSVRRLGSQEQTVMSLDAAIASLRDEAREPDTILPKPSEPRSYLETEPLFDIAARA